MINNNMFLYIFDYIHNSVFLIFAIIFLTPELSESDLKQSVSYIELLSLSYVSVVVVSCLFYYIILNFLY